MEEMVELYVHRGMSQEDAQHVVELIADHRAFFVDVMTVEELGLQLPGEDNNPWKDGLVTFVSFVLFAIIPLLGYSIFPLLSPGMSPQALYRAACVVTAFTLFLLGSVAACFSPKPWYRGGLEMMAVGLVVSVLAFGIGGAAESMLGTSDNPFGDVLY
jgi:VIT1/CCC1 family predicted Fe2+/Mn2+ transporter